MTRAEGDFVEQLLSELAPQERGEARRVITFFRLLKDAGRGTRAEAVGFGLERVQAELLRGARREALETLDDLLSHVIATLLPGDTFVDAGRPRRSWALAWGRCERLRGELGATSVLPDFPPPGEPPLRTAKRILSAARTCGASEAWNLSRAARLARVESGPRASERLWRSFLARAEASDWGDGWRALGVAAIGRLRLEVGDVHGARAVLDDALELASLDEELAWLSAWAFLLSGDAETASELVRDRDPRRGALPLPLFELRQREPAWRGILSGTQTGSGCEPEEARWTTRLEARGALFFGVFWLDSGGSPRPLVLDAAPAVRAELPQRLAGRAGRLARAGEPEHRVVTEARPQLEIDARPGGLAGSVSDGVRARALVPIGDEEGEPRGWLQVEFDHLLLPARERLAAVARAWRGEVLEAAGAELPASREQPEHRRPQAAQARSDAPRLPAAPHAQREALLGWLQGFARRLGVKPGRRRFFLFVGSSRRLASAAPELAPQAHFGTDLADWGARPGRFRALARAARARAPVVFEQPSEGLSVHAEAGSGVVLPLVFLGRVGALVAIESRRARDFRNGDLQRLAQRSSGAVASLERLRFALWHRAHFTADVALDPGARTWRARERELELALSARSLVLVGPAGAGKTVLLRWLAHQASEDPWEFWSPGEADGGTPVRVVRALDAMKSQEQAELARHLGAGYACRWIAMARRPLDECVRAGSLHPGLAASFGQAQIAVPSLCERRDELGGITDALLDSHGRRAGLVPPRLDDEARALLWRQGWPGNVRELEACLGQLLRLHAGALVRGPELWAWAERSGRSWRRRIPSRRPRRSDLEAALETTALSNGRWNKTRAARYLGWDPDTLALRLSEQGL